MGRSPFAVVRASLPYLPQDALGVDEGRAVADVVNHHEAVGPVHRLLQNAPGLGALGPPREIHDVNGRTVVGVCVLVVLAPDLIKVTLSLMSKYNINQKENKMCKI